MSEPGVPVINETRKLTGRTVITTKETAISRNNLIKVLNDSLSIHATNRSDIDYLYKYYKGDQPIWGKTKDVRSDINNKIVENRANEIVSFKTGYLCGEPIQYVSRKGDDATVKSVTRLNEYMFAEDKASQDQALVEWQNIAGTAYRMVLPDALGEEDEAPFELYVLDPRNSFITYSRRLGRYPLMSVQCYEASDDPDRLYCIYTKDRYYEVLNGTEIIKDEPHSLGMIPVFEYPANNARLGAFEIVLPLLDAINNMDSNRMDGVEQFIQSFWKFVGCNLNLDQYHEFLKEGAILVPPNDTGGNIDVDLVTRELNQQQSQTFKEDLYGAVLTICGMPNRNGGSSTSDTGSAVLLRDGWSDAEARAKDSENIFKLSEKRMLKLVLRICRDLSDMDLHLMDVEMKFTRRNYDNIQSKSQVLVSMLQSGKIHPQLAFQSCGLFSDAQEAYAMSMEYYEQQLKEWEPTEVSEEIDEPNNEGDVV